MNSNEVAKLSSQPVPETDPKTREELLSEVSEKALGHQKQVDSETRRAAEQLKEEIYQHIDEPSY